MVPLPVNVAFDSEEDRLTSVSFTEEISMVPECKKNEKGKTRIKNAAVRFRDFLGKHRQGNLELVSEYKGIKNNVTVRCSIHQTETTINAGNSGTLARLLLGSLIKSKKTVKIIGDKSLSKRDFSRVTEPLKKFGVNIK